MITCLYQQNIEMLFDMTNVLGYEQGCYSETSTVPLLTSMPQTSKQLHVEHNTSEIDY